MTRRKVNPTVLRSKIETLYIAITAAKTPHGAVTWFAEEIGVGVRTLARWCAGDGDPPQMVEMLVDYMQKYDTGHRVLDMARERRDDWHRERGGADDDVLEG